MLERIDGKYVHKLNAQNVLIADVRRRPGPEEWYDAEMVHDMEHPFFFEHPLDHIPAMMLVEAGRQLGIAISHLFLGVPFGTVFVTRSFDIQFTEFAEKQTPVLVSGLVTDKQYRRRELVQIRLDGLFAQDGHLLGSMGGTWNMLSPDLWQRYRRLGQHRNSAG